MARDDDDDDRERRRQAVMWFLGAAAMVGGPPVARSAPVISGSTIVGQQLFCFRGLWDGTDPKSYSYEWFAVDAPPVSIGTGPIYTLQPGDNTKFIFCTVTATNADASASANSNTVGPITNAQTITPALFTNEQLFGLPAVTVPMPQTLAPARVENLPLFFVPSVTVATLEPPANAGGANAPNIADTTPWVDEELNVTDGIWSGTTPMTFDYEWHRVTEDPPGATLTDDDGEDLTVDGEPLTT